MKLTHRLWFGLWGALALALGIDGLAMMVPGYSQVQQTVSEIGEVGSPARVPFAAMLFVVAACILVFASAVREVLLEAGRSRWAAYMIGLMAVSTAGVGVFAYPHPLHNVFGLSETIGYLAPLAFALSWRRDPQARALVALSWVAFALILIAIVLNLGVLDTHGFIRAYLKPNIGLVQRALFAAWFGWCAAIGIMLFQRERRSAVGSGVSLAARRVRPGAATDSQPTTRTPMS